MSDVGIGILIFVGVMGLVALIRFLAWLTDLKDTHGSLPRAGAHAIQRYVLVQPVKRSEDKKPDVPRVMSRETPQTEPDEDRRGSDGRVSAASQWMERVRVDRTKTAWLELMVYSGYTVPEIRAILKGDNGVLGTEIEAARKRLGIDPPAQHVTPIVGRPTNAQFDADYPYKPLEV